jgi:hypothetical protein
VEQITTVGIDLALQLRGSAYSPRLPRRMRSAARWRRRSTTQWYGLPPLLYGIAMYQIGNWSCPIHEQGGVRHEGYNEWN